MVRWSVDDCKGGKINGISAREVSKEENSKMNLRVKKTLATLVMSVMFTTSVLAATSSTFNMTVDRDGYTYSTDTAKKGNNYSFGTLTLTSGGVDSRSKLYAKIATEDNSSCYTYLSQINSNGTTIRPNYTTAAMETDYYMTYDFAVAAFLDRSSYTTQSTLAGSFTP